MRETSQQGLVERESTTRSVRRSMHSFEGKGAEIHLRRCQVIFALLGISAMYYWNAVLNVLYSIIVVKAPDDVISITNIYTTVAVVCAFGLSIRGAGEKWMFYVGGLLLASMCLIFPVLACHLPAHASGTSLHLASCIAGVGEMLFQCSGYSFAVLLSKRFAGYISFGYGACGVITFALWLFLTQGIFAQTNAAGQWNETSMTAAVWCQFGLGFVIITTCVILTHCYLFQLPEMQQAIRMAKCNISIDLCNLPQDSNRQIFCAPSITGESRQPHEIVLNELYPDQERKKDTPISITSRHNTQDNSVNCVAVKNTYVNDKEGARTLGRNEPSLLREPQKRSSLHSSSKVTGPSPELIKGEDTKIALGDNLGDDENTEEAHTRATRLIAQMKDLLKIFEQTWQLQIGLGLCQGISMMAYPLIGPYQFNLSVRRNDILTGIFQCGDFLGRYIPNFSSYFPMLLLPARFMLPLTVLRVIILILFILTAKYTVEGDPQNILTQYSTQIVLMGALAVSHGYYGSVFMIRMTESLHNPQQKTKASAMAVCLLVACIAVGMWLARLVHFSA